MCFAFVDLSNKLYKMRGKYMKEWAVVYLCIRAAF